ncbi:tRNA (guanosine(46)-N7)-methyltransferase TrmB [Aeromicrobium duanguangcaii]|uniref:tRNA (guanosine(46)-N7)-methyltransferase TrmB n=1 Tax=Aeromicrobium duanguangcaii TaxID=2968086 RepID=UPI002017CD17|nr:tRNA (guanosine(46)-N7)-methyltransferase TrmB [Aeromicrobium duanguangcaii]MCL3836238.1 tRNA (guanosine(46)-N7)-methyltransferase TrmB [Aeromicrobium duanguangcaii]
MPQTAEDRRDRAEEPSRREIVSFTRRGGRLTERLQGAWDDLAERFVADIPRGRTSTSVAEGFTLDPATLFGREAPLVLEIGSGRGESLVHAARENPDTDFLGLEVYVPGVAQTLLSMRHHGVENIRLIIVDAVPALSRMLPAECLDELRIWFPDPWHKTRHHKRRLVSDEFVPVARRALKPGGVWRMATDWQDYADQMLDVVNRAEGFTTSGDWAERFPDRPVTRFEAKGLAVGRTIRDVKAIKMSA